MDNKWIADLKVGDTVVRRTFGFGEQMYLAKVARLTKTLIVVKDHDTSEVEHRYRHDDGREAGAYHYHQSHLEEATQDKINEVSVQNIRLRCLHRIRNTEWQKLPTEVLVTIATAVAKKAV